MEPHSQPCQRCSRRRPIKSFTIISGLMILEGDGAQGQGELLLQASTAMTKNSNCEHIPIETQWNGASADFRKRTKVYGIALNPGGSTCLHFTIARLYYNTINPAVRVQSMILFCSGGRTWKYGWTGAKFTLGGFWIETAAVVPRDWMGFGHHPQEILV